MRDFQRSAVYEWENTCIHPYDNTFIPFEQISSLVQYVWHAEGLAYPPSITYLPPQTRKCEGKADRLEVKFSKTNQTRSSVVLHELAHSLTNEYVNDIVVSDYHGPKFVGILMQLFDRYMRFELSYLRNTANRFKIQYDLEAKPFKVID